MSASKLPKGQSAAGSQSCVWPSVSGSVAHRLLTVVFPTRPSSSFRLITRTDAKSHLACLQLKPAITTTSTADDHISEAQLTPIQQPEVELSKILSTLVCHKLT